MEEETLTKMAVEQYLQGKTAVSIYREMGRSKHWFFKWLGRYQSGDPNWYRDRPRVPRSHPRQISPEMRNLIINIRTQLEEHPYAQTGTSAIKWECKKLGVIAPSDRTINRILKREGLVKKNSLYPQRGGIPLFQKALGDQQHPSSGPPRATIHQKRWTFLFAQCHGSLESPSLSSSPTKKRRPSRGSGLDQLLEDYGYARLSSGRQPTLFSRKQSLPPFLRHYPEGVSAFGDRGGLHPDRRTLA
jgi:transposase-like protein